MIKPTKTIRDGRGNTYLFQLPEPRTVTDWVSKVTATHVVLWFNHSTRDWVVSLGDEQGVQIGESQYCGSRQWADEEVSDLVTGVTYSVGSY